MVHLAVGSAKILGISVLVSDNGCDKQPSYDCCGAGTKWFKDHRKTAHHYHVIDIS